VIAAYSYTLDGNGNRVSIDKNIPTVGTLPVRNETASYSHNRLTSTDSALYGYDNEGQLASKQEGGTTSYSFDKAYRLTGIGNTESFSYDGAGNRLRAVRNGVETRYIHDAGGNLLAEADSSNTITRYYVHGAGLLAAITPADDLYCYHYDGVGNTVAITDSSGTVVNSYDYSPFGMILAENESFAQPFKFVGKLGVMAESNGFYYMRARYYDPVIGRFISEDPLGFDGGDVNLYVYGSNNPLLVVDPWGLEAGLAGRIWHDAVSATRQGFHAAVWLATEGPAPARYTLQSAVALAAAPFAAVATMETGSALATVGRAAMNVARAHPVATERAIHFAEGALGPYAPATTAAGVAGALTGHYGPALIQNIWQGSSSRTSTVNNNSGK
jgi:RHS repeat-associated protein